MCTCMHRWSKLLSIMETGANSCSIQHNSNTVPVVFLLLVARQFPGVAWHRYFKNFIIYYQECASPKNNWCQEAMSGHCKRMWLAFLTSRMLLKDCFSKLLSPVVIATILLWPQELNHFSITYTCHCDVLWCHILRPKEGGMSGVAASCRERIIDF